MFEESIQELESLVEQMEHGQLSLDETLQHFERGVKLTGLCQKALEQAEQRVQTLQAKAELSVQNAEEE